MSELLSASPQDMRDDEQAIGKGYKKQAGVTVFCVVAGYASTYLDLKIVIVVSAMVLLGAITFCEARLYDLCIRMRRSNQIAYENGARLAQLQDTMRRLDTKLQTMATPPTAG